MAGKGGKGLLAGKTPAGGAGGNKDKVKKGPTSRSSRAGLQVLFLFMFDRSRFCFLDT